MKRPWPNLKNRATTAELMDNPTLEPAELAESLAQLRRINWWLGSARLSLEGIRRLWQQAGRPDRLSLLDVGTGSGDSAGPILQWAGRQGVAMHLTLLDINPQTCAIARHRLEAETRVSVMQGDVKRLGVRQVDIVLASLFLHHFSAGQVTTVLNSMRRAARLGVVVNDLHRHWLAWAFIKGATQLFSGNRLIRSDAPLSVRRGFCKADLEQLKNEVGLDQLSYSWRPLFRYLIILPAGNHNGGSTALNRGEQIYE